MQNLIADDDSRCGNRNCDIKHNCARYRQVDIDINNRVWTYLSTNFEKIDGEPCQYFIFKCRKPIGL